MIYHQKEIICISHGSSGFGETEKYIGDYFNNLGYQVIFNNYLSDNGIEKLNWYNSAEFNDEYNVTLNELCNMVLPIDKSIIHIGFSLGGYVGIVNSDKFIKNYCFYPGILPLHDSIKNKDFSNTTFFLPQYDNWCTNTQSFINELRTSPKVIYIDATHGFMLLNKDRSFDVLTYDFPIFVNQNELEQFVFNHKILTSKYKHQYTTVNLRSDYIAASICLEYIVNEIQLLKEITASE
jgi:hypothetical protein